MVAQGAHAAKRYEPIAALANRRGWRDRVTELSINGPHDAWIRLAGEGYVKIPPAELKFLDLQWFKGLCQFLAAEEGMQFTEGYPLLACRTPLGQRFQGIVGPNVKSGMAASIRFPRLKETTWDDFEVAPADRERLEQCIADEKSIFVSGGTGSGKTTFIKLLINRCIPRDKRIVTLEDTYELDPPHENAVQLLVSRGETKSRVGWADLIDNTLRFNPNVFIPGELSIKSAFPTLQIFDTGHAGTLTTMHANSPMDALRGFRRRVALGGGSVSSELESMMEFFAENIGLVVQIKHMEVADNTERRVVTHVESPKDLLGGRTLRQAFGDREKAFDRRADIGFARAMLAAMAGGDRITAIEDRMTSMLCAIGILGTKPARQAAASDEEGDATLLSAEERTAAYALAHGLMLGREEAVARAEAEPLR